MIALDNDHNEVAKLLLDHGANPDLWDWWGRTAALHRYRQKRSRARSAPDRDPDHPNRSHGSIATHAAGRPPISNIEMIHTLLAAGVDVNPQLNMHRPSRGGNSGRSWRSSITPDARLCCAPPSPATWKSARALLERGASPSISGMGLTPFLIAAGVGTGGRGTGLASSTSSGGAANIALMDLLLEHGADVNAQVTGTKTYSLRISRAPSSTEGMTALHVAAQRGRADVVRYLLAKGAKSDLLDASGRKPIDLVGTGGHARGSRGHLFRGCSRSRFGSSRRTAFVWR